MKSNVNFAPALETASPATGLRGQRPALSLQKGIEHGPATIALGPAVRLPVLPRGRAYLKALREAELAAWDTAKPLTDVRPKPTVKPVRLPSPQPEVAENRLYAVLAILCALTLAYEVRSLLLSAGNWRDFVEFVRVFIA